MNSKMLLVTNPFLRVSFGPKITIDLLLDKKKIEIADERIIILLNKINSPLKFEEILSLIQATWKCSEENARVALNELLKQELIVDKEKHADTIDGVRHWYDRKWLDALVFHLKTRDLNYSDVGLADGTPKKTNLINNILETEKLEIWKDIETDLVIDLPHLPIDESVLTKPFEDVLLSRRSNQRYKDKSISIDNLGYIFSSTNQELKRVREKVEENLVQDKSLFLNSLFIANETYIFVYDVEDIEQGFYFYDPKNHQLKLIKKGNFREFGRKLCVGQSRAGDGGCLIILTAIWERYMVRYRHPRAYRTLLINTAELAQKYLLGATTCELSTFITPAFLKHIAHDELGFKVFEEDPLYAIGIG